MMTNNQNILKWFEEMKALCKPDNVVWIDGSEEQLAELRELGIPVIREVKLLPVFELPVSGLFPGARRVHLALEQHLF